MDSKKNLTNCKNENDEPKGQNSNDSLISVIFPWRGRRSDLRRAIVSRNETGRTITTIGFYMCLMSVMLLTTGIGLTCASGWILIYRVPYVYLSDGSFLFGIDSFTMIAGMLSFPCCWIAWVCHNNKKYYSILPVLMVLVSFSTCMLSTGLGIAFVDKSKMSFDYSISPPKLTNNGHYRSMLNDTMSETMTNYDTNCKLRWSWNTVQRRLKCCGTNGPADWLKYRRKVPQSCYLGKKSKVKTSFVLGCLDAISSELSWEICFLTGLSFISLSLMILLAISIFLTSTTMAIIFMNKSRITVDYSTSPPKLGDCQFRTVLNKTMTSGMEIYDVSKSAHCSWDAVQQRLECCGTKGPEDWFKFRMLLPCSCFYNAGASSPKVQFVRGCLDLITQEVIWENSLITAVTSVTFCVQSGTLLLAAFVYLNDRISKTRADVETRL